jgi:hypothetical protein
MRSHAFVAKTTTATATAASSYEKVQNPAAAVVTAATARATAVSQQQQEPSVVPLAHALRVPDSQLSEEERERLALQNVDLQAEVERQRIELEQQQQAAAEQKKKRRIWIGTSIAVMVLLILVATTVGVYCGGDANRCGRRGGPTTLTPAPTVPMRPMEDIEFIRSFINNITLSNQTLRYPSNETAEERALQWLIDEDVIFTNIDGWFYYRIVEQRYALATLWLNSLPTTMPFGGPAHDATWTNPDIYVCEWTGVKCDDHSSRFVVELDLENDGVRGPIPDDLGLLTELTELRLSYNALTGTIPSSLAAMSFLTVLGLFDNQLNGTVPFCNGSIPTQSFEILWADCDNCPCCDGCVENRMKQMNK